MAVSDEQRAELRRDLTRLSNRASHNNPECVLVNRSRVLRPCLALLDDLELLEALKAIANKAEDGLISDMYAALDWIEKRARIAIAYQKPDHTIADDDPIHDATGQGRC